MALQFSHSVCVSLNMEVSCILYPFSKRSTYIWQACNVGIHDSSRKIVLSTDVGYLLHIAHYMCSCIVDIRNEEFYIGEYGAFFFVFDTYKMGICPYRDVVNTHYIFVLGVYGSLNVVLFCASTCLGIFPVDVDVSEIESSFWYRSSSVRCV